MSLHLQRSASGPILTSNDLPISRNFGCSFIPPKPCCKHSFLLCSFLLGERRLRSREVKQTSVLDLWIWMVVVNVLVFFLNDFISEGQMLRVFWSCWTVTIFTWEDTGQVALDRKLHWKSPFFFLFVGARGFACHQVSSEFKDQLSSLMARDLSSKQHKQRDPTRLDPNKNHSRSCVASGTFPGFVHWECLKISRFSQKMRDPGIPPQGPESNHVEVFRLKLGASKYSPTSGLTGGPGWIGLPSGSLDLLSM